MFEFPHAMYTFLYFVSYVNLMFMTTFITVSSREVIQIDQKCILKTYKPCNSKNREWIPPPPDNTRKIMQRSHRWCTLFSSCLHVFAMTQSACATSVCSVHLPLLERGTLRFKALVSVAKHWGVSLPLSIYCVHTTPATSSTLSAASLYLSPPPGYPLLPT